MCHDINFEKVINGGTVYEKYELFILKYLNWPLGGSNRFVENARRSFAIQNPTFSCQEVNIIFAKWRDHVSNP